jgi:hypothetical protein
MDIFQAFVVAVAVVAAWWLWLCRNHGSRKNSTVGKVIPSETFLAPFRSLARRNLQTPDATIPCTFFCVSRKCALIVGLLFFGLWCRLALRFW